MKMYKNSGIGALGIVFMCGVAFCQFVHNSKGRQFIKAVKPIQVACQEGVCPVVPVGWEEIKCGVDYGRIHSFFPEGTKACAFFMITRFQSYIYHTDYNKFLVTWHYLTDSDLEAEGGKDHPLKVIKKFRGEKNVILYDEVDNN